MLDKYCCKDNIPEGSYSSARVCRSNILDFTFDDVIFKMNILFLIAYNTEMLNYLSFSFILQAEEISYNA